LWHTHTSLAAQHVSKDTVKFKYRYVLKHKTWLSIFSADIYVAHFNCRDLSYYRANLQSTAKFGVGMTLEIK